MSRVGAFRVVRGSGETFSDEAFAAIRAHPDFRAAVEGLARENLANYAGWSISERWLLSDLGRASLSGAAMMLDALFDGFTPAHLIQSALANRTCSEGRARHYLRRALANGFLTRDDTGTLRLSPRMHDVMGRGIAAMMHAVARLDPGLAHLRDMTRDTQFTRRLATQMGLNTVARRDLFVGPDKPVLLFLGRDGGSRMMEQLIAAQPAGRSRLLERAPVSQRALAQGAFVSRTHVARLLADGEARGLFQAQACGMVVAPDLSEDVERHYALVLEMGRVSAHAALTGPA